MRSRSAASMHSCITDDGIRISVRAERRARAAPTWRVVIVISTARRNLDRALHCGDSSDPGAVRTIPDFLDVLGVLGVGGSLPRICRIRSRVMLSSVLYTITTAIQFVI